jgi:hypothetical protein
METETKSELQAEYDKAWENIEFLLREIITYEILILRYLNSLYRLQQTTVPAATAEPAKA